VLSTLSDEGTPVSIPIWFEWDGQYARVFSVTNSPKIRRIEKNPAASLLVANPTGEPEAWVLIEGVISIESGGAFDLAKRLALRYWDLANPAHSKTVEDWRATADTLRVLELVPTRMRSYRTDSAS
jgi:nitroimidazol reductase NimA-like FMN-containing flavoprotein (pyridoxamine 5'-phosphate oxidase superfamily)